MGGPWWYSGKGAVLQIGRSLLRSQVVSLVFSIDIKSFRSHYGPGVDSASNRNKYQEHFVGGKGGRCVRLTTYHHPVPLSRNLGTLTSWNPLGTSGNVTGMIYFCMFGVGSGNVSMQRLCWELFMVRLITFASYEMACGKTW